MLYHKVLRYVNYSLLVPVGFGVGLFSISNTTYML